MSVASEGIWFPIANNHYLHKPINDQPADSIRSIIDKPGTLSGKPVGELFPVADIHHPSINDRQADEPIINQQETSSGKSGGNRKPTRYPTYWSQFGSKAKADFGGWIHPTGHRPGSSRLVMSSGNDPVLPAAWYAFHRHRLHEGRGSTPLLDPSDQGS
jgi:hypothetical protein